MSRDRYGVDSERPISDTGGQGTSPERSDKPSNQSRPEDRDDYFDKPPFRKEQGQRTPDPSRTSPAERYSYHKRPLE